MLSPQLYYPQHFKKTRPYLSAFQEGIKQLTALNKLNTTTSLDLSVRLISDGYRAQGIDLRSSQFDAKSFTVENQGALAYGEWLVQGAVVYDFEAPLTEALMSTGVGDVAISDLHFPFRCVYFHFGPQKDLMLQSGAQVTGAYLLMAEGSSLRICLTAPLSEDTPWLQRSAEIYDLRISAEHFGKDIESAITHALADDIADLEKASKILMEQGTPVTAQGSRATVSFLEAHRANQEVFNRSLQLIANGICYLTGYPEDVKSDWQRNTPEKLKNKSKSGAPKEAGRAVSKLNAMGYHRVNFVGGSFSDAVAHAPEGQMSPHWRRGHWRRQPHGPQMSLRKLIWLKPTRVMGGIVPDEPRVYSTKTPE